VEDECSGLLLLSESSSIRIYLNSGAFHIICLLSVSRDFGALRANTPVVGMLVYFSMWKSYPVPKTDKDLHMICSEISLTSEKSCIECVPNSSPETLEF